MEVPIDLAQPRFMKRKESISYPSLFDDSDSSFERLKTALESPPAERTEGQINSLVAFSRHMKFFSELRDTISENAHFQCCRHLTYVHYPSGKVLSTQLVFHEGDEGSQFYIILSGSCAVLSSSGASNFKKKLRLLTILRPGECFGELALISHMPRAASVLCREECNFAVLERNDYTQILGTIQDRQLYERIELLRQHPIISGWKRDAVQRLSYYFKVRNVKRKQALFIAGQATNEVFVIQEGEFHLSKTIVSYSAGKIRHRQIQREVDVGTVRSGELLGAAQSLDDSCYDYTCYCASQTGEALVIPKQNFKTVLTNENSLSILLSFEREKNRYREKQITATLLVKGVRYSVPMISEKGYQSLLSKSKGVQKEKPPRPVTRFQTPTRYCNDPTQGRMLRKKSLADLDQKMLTLPTFSPEAESRDGGEGYIREKYMHQDRLSISKQSKLVLNRSQPTPEPSDFCISRNSSFPNLSATMSEKSVTPSLKLRYAM